MNPFLAGLAVLLVSSAVLAQDSVQTDPDKYAVLLENNCVRVLDYRDQPGQKTQQHQHPAFTLYALAPFQRAIHLPDGKVLNRSFKAGEVIWSPAQVHLGENTGTTPTRALIVESKPSGRDRPECGGG